MKRVRDRVLQGGHDVPEVAVRRRFDRSIQNFLDYYRQLGNSWILFDNSGASPAMVAFEALGEKPRIVEFTLYEALTSRYGRP